MDKFLLFMVRLVIEGIFTVSVRGLTEKYACLGDSVQAFNNIDFDRCNARISLSINGNRNIEIATWLLHNCTLNTTVIKNYKDRVALYENGTLTINNFHHFDQGKYTVMSRKDTFPWVQEVEIKLMVAPNKNCKPVIQRVGEKLFASVNHEDCGRPLGTVYWKGYYDAHDTHAPTIKIISDDEPHTYVACLNGSALRCAKSLTPQDVCSIFVTEGSKVNPAVWHTTDTSPREPHESCSTSVFIALIIVLVTLFMAAVVVIVILIMRLRRITGNSKKKQNELFLEMYPDEETQLEQLRPLTNESHQCSERQKVDQGLIETVAENQSGIDPKKFQLLQELRDAAYCKICYLNKLNVCFMPCNHIAACSNCSDNLQECPVCRAAIKEKRNISF